MTPRRWWAACALAAVVALLATLPTTGDFGLTWDEPAYRYSQVYSAHWWERLFAGDDPAALLDPKALLYYWPYGRFGINFHPPLSGQLNLLTHSLFGGFLRDYPARRVASVLEFSATLTLLFGFLAWRYGPWVGGIAAGALLLMPRVYGQAHLAETDTPGLLIWALAAVAFWKGLHDTGGRRWRVLVGVLLGLAFVQKMATVLVLLPLLAWLAATRLPRTFTRPGGRAAWVDGLLTLGAMLVPLGLAFLEIRRLATILPPPNRAVSMLFEPPPNLHSPLPGAVLLLPMVVWAVRRLLARLFPASRLWGVERPGLETLAAVAAFAPAVGWLGNPAWWSETLPRLAHYYALNTNRQGALPDIRILYWGEIYEYSLPWHNAWVLMAVTVPAGILLASGLGLIRAAWRARVDPLPAYFAVHLAALPLLRMTPTPGHDGVRLFLPTFFFLAAMAGWGTVAAAEALGGRRWVKGVLAALVLGPAAVQCAWIHPFELSYYNEFAGGTRGAWRSGFELTYWYDAMDGPALAEINRRLPPDAELAFPAELSAPSMVVQDLQNLGQLRGDVRFGWDGATTFPHMLLLTHDSKASAFSRLLHAMTPWNARTPRQLGGVRVLTVTDPAATARAWALWLLAAEPDGPKRPEPPRAPESVRRLAPPLARFWGDGLARVPPPRPFEPSFAWAASDPDGLRAAADALAAGRADDPGARRLRAILERFPARNLANLLNARPAAIREAAEILIRRPDDVRRVLTRPGYLDTDVLDGGYLDAGVPAEATSSRRPDPARVDPRPTTAAASASPTRATAAPSM